MKAYSSSSITDVVFNHYATFRRVSPVFDDVTILVFFGFFLTDYLPEYTLFLVDRVGEFDDELYFERLLLLLIDSESLSLELSEELVSSSDMARQLSSSTIAFYSSCIISISFSCWYDRSLMARSKLFCIYANFFSFSSPIS